MVQTAYITPFALRLEIEHVYLIYEKSYTITSMSLAKEIESYFDRLWPILRSITGEGVRQTHTILSELVPLERFEIPTGTQVFDWTIPKEWRVREAYVIDPNGTRILDVRNNNLHLLNYSVPFQGVLSKSELNDHLYSLPDKPDAIPYITSYYAPRWGFCLSQHERDALLDGDYQVVVDTELIDGSLTLSEAVLPGESKEEVLLSTYTCHPSLANNELSGPLVTAFLYRALAALPKRRLTYRFVFLPETIGAIAYLQLRGEHLKKHLVAAYVVTCIGDKGNFTYKRSRQETSLADRAAEHCLKQHSLKHSAKPHSILSFSPLGSDERQYCSPGFNLPVGSLMRSMYGTYPEYHTSLDNKNFISFEAMAESVEMYLTILKALESNRTYTNLYPHGEPQLGKRGLYETLGRNTIPELSSAVFWLLNYSDGNHDLLWIAAKSGYGIELLEKAAQACLEAGLIARG
jgi:aminopeptidase-like protein